MRVRYTAKRPKCVPKFAFGLTAFMLHLAKRINRQVIDTQLWNSGGWWECLTTHVFGPQWSLVSWPFAVLHWWPVSNNTHSPRTSLTHYVSLYISSFLFLTCSGWTFKLTAVHDSILKNDKMGDDDRKGDDHDSLFDKEKQGMFWQVKGLELTKVHFCNINQRNPSDLEPFAFLGCADLTGAHLCYHYCGSKLPGGRSQLIPNYSCSHFKGLTSTHMCWQSMWHIKSCLNWRAGIPQKYLYRAPWDFR